jgi:hypothetical protein
MSVEPSHGNRQPQQPFVSAAPTDPAARLTDPPPATQPATHHPPDRGRAAAFRRRAGGREIRRVRVRHAGCSEDPEETMKSLKWAATLGIVAVCVILFLNRDDVMRYQKMRQMS